MAARKRPPSPALGSQDDQALLTPGPVRDRLLDQLRRQGARDVRTNVIYGRVKQQGYGAYDDLVNAARARGMHVQVTLMGTPRYASQWDQGLSYQHNDPRVWQQFAQQTAQHFRGRVARYSIGNEENHPAFLAGSDTNPVAAGRQYRGIYRAGYAGVKAADKGAQVLLGELTNAPRNREFLRAVLGGKPLKTAGLAYHPYRGQGSWDIDQLADLQAMLARYKRQGRLQTAKGSQAPLYLTEYGVQRGTMSDQDRLRDLAAAYAKARQAKARQLVQYQLTPTPRKTVAVPGDPVRDGYGAFAGFGAGRTQQAPGFVWDTSIGDAQGNLPVINRGLSLQPSVTAARARAARVARKRR